MIRKNDLVKSRISGPFLSRDKVIRRMKGMLKVVDSRRIGRDSFAIVEDRQGFQFEVNTKCISFVRRPKYKTLRAKRVEEIRKMSMKDKLSLLMTLMERKNETV